MKKTVSAPAAHIMALLTMIVWGTTFIASKLLLSEYTPPQIMIMRFFIAYIMLWALRPKIMKLPLKEELCCAALGLTGGSLYFFGENYALTYTLTSNVSILLAFAPILTAVLAHFIPPNEKLTKHTLIGFAVAIFGVALVVFNGAVVLKLNPIGDLLSIGAALSWAIYSILMKRCVTRYDNLLLTRRVMLWALVTTLPAALLGGESFSLAPLGNPRLLICILFLGVLGSAVSYVVWNEVIRRLGSVVSNNYIYLLPFVTMVAAGIILKEPISWMGICGAGLIILGVLISDRKLLKK